MADRFMSPPPTFQATTNPTAIEAITPKPKDTSPQPSVVERLQQEGHYQLADLLTRAQVSAKQHAVAITATQRRVSKSERSHPRWEENKPVAKQPISQPSSNDVCSDREFVIRTRTLDPHSPQGKALFYANGGSAYLVHGRSYAAAWDLMRREKMQAAMRRGK
jgi:hypothetical protein